jgi:hypothetical protein
MQWWSRGFVIGGISALCFCAGLSGHPGDEPPADPEQLAVSHAECSYFGPQRERFVEAALRTSGGRLASPRSLSSITNQVAAALAPIPGGSRTHTLDQSHAPGSIDSYIWADFAANNITPAPPTTDWEFVRRVTLDLTGRVPTPDRVQSFVADTTPGKRAKLIEELLAKPEWVDKWTMFYGDLFRNSDQTPSLGLRRYPEGRNAFYSWIKDALAKEKPYNQMATELISANGSSNYTDGPTGWLVGSRVTGGPNQDIYDQMASNTSETFLGIAHMNCLLCHNGRGHVDSLSLWAGQTTRYQAWQFASYFSRTLPRATNTTGIINNAQFWALSDNYTANFNADYALNTTTGNRPARVAPPGCKSNQQCWYVPPAYIFNQDTVKTGDNYRAAVAKSITSDFQFARAAVNYVWAEFFGRGIVDPPNLFDPARLDPDNPPAAPWTLQPSNARLLNALAQHFIDSGYSLKALMGEIANSDVYQLSSRYDGTWNAQWEPYFARHFVRRMWAEEVHDAIVQTSGSIPTYNVANFSSLGYGAVNYSMQFPETFPGIPDGTVGPVLDSYLRGNRDDQPRKREGSILQALNMMNGTLVESRLGNMPLITQNIGKTNSDLVNLLFLNILSRYPTSDELSKAVAALPTASGTARTSAVQDLVWSLYNKVDFVFNY